MGGGCGAYTCSSGGRDTAEMWALTVFTLQAILSVCEPTTTAIPAPPTTPSGAVGTPMVGATPRRDVHEQQLLLLLLLFCGPHAWEVVVAAERLGWHAGSSSTCWRACVRRQVV